MSRIPPNLLYLAIYNPTLRPIDPVAEDEEDAEEQAHILFYTSKERAVSRDRMLRQVGLAKALVNFSDMMNNGSGTCNNVHSQSKRMIMVSPEPDFWIHAAIEVAKVPRSPLEKGKGKASDRSRHIEKGKDKEKNPDSVPIFDYQEGSVHDLAPRADILRGYERFKLTHGSFTSILSKLGREALSLQLERFFTVWAWSWNLEDGSEFLDHLGIPLYPTFRALIPILDSISEKYRKASLFIQPPHVVPSSQYFASSYPTSLPQHLLSLIPPLSSISNDHSLEGKIPSDDTSTGKDGTKSTLETPNSTFLGIPTANMDMRKWNWPGYLTFGKGSGKRPGLEGADTFAPSPESAPAAVPEPPILSPGLIKLDTNALEDAFLDSVPADVTDTAITHEESRTSPIEANDTELTETRISHIRNPADTEASSVTQETTTAATYSTQPVEQHLQQLSSIGVYLADSGNPLHTTRQKIFYVLHDHKMLALVGFEEDPSTSAPEIAQTMLTVLEDIDALVTEELTKTITPEQLPSAQRILQPTDTHIISSGGYTVSSPNFSSQSGHLYDAQELQTTDPDIIEVFSRGLNPQHWHVARRSIDTDIYNQGSTEQGEAYMQIFRKEASLSDVDNVLVGVTRRAP